MKFMYLVAFGLLVGCSSNDSTSQNIQQQHSPTTTPVASAKPTFEDPPKEQSQIIFESNKEFHQKDCQGYRKHFNISKEKFPCQSDNDIQFIESAIMDFKHWGISDSSVYIGYREDKDSFYYRTHINVYINFFDEHSSHSTLSFEGVDTRDVIAATCPTISVWDYEAHEWIIDSFSCDEETIERVDVGVEKETTISFDYFYGLGETKASLTETSLSSLIHNEEIIQVRMSVWTVPNEIRSGGMVREEKRIYYIPTTEIRKDMHKAWSFVDN